MTNERGKENEKNYEKPDKTFSCHDTVSNFNHYPVTGKFAGSDRCENGCAGQKVTWDCITFGSYPQTEIVDKASTSGVYGIVWGKSSDYEVNSSLYSKLKNATWDAADNTLIGGIKYKRLKKSQATFVGYNGKVEYDYVRKEGYYNWISGITYHYFRYEPIRWRVLNVYENTALLLSDRILDNIQNSGYSWESTDVRGWLNGYGPYEYGWPDFRKDNFANAAFTSEEITAIKKTSLKNLKSIRFGTGEGENTVDKIFCLSETEVSNTDKAKSYGFVSTEDTLDEARIIKGSTYAKAKGILNAKISPILGNASWWLRTSAETDTSAMTISASGSVSTLGWDFEDIFDEPIIGIAPALYLDLSNSKVWNYAGTISSEKIKRNKLTFVEKNKTIPLGSEYVFCAAYYIPEDVDEIINVSYTSSNTDVAKMRDMYGDYIITPKKCGTFTITISFAGTDYHEPATQTITVTVVPKKTSLIRVSSPKKKQLKITWRKNTTADGYQIYCATNSSFTKGLKKITIKSQKTVGKTITKLISRKKYYVKIRAYKKVGSKTYYGAWSSVKSCKAK